MNLALRNLLFTVVVPGTVAVYGPLALAGADYDRYCSNVRRWI